MTIKKRPSLRKCINDHCKCCIYDPDAAGTWRQQVTLCSVTLCPLYPARPKTKASIPDSVLDYYDLMEHKRALYGRSRPRDGHFKERNPANLGPPIKAA